MATAENKKRKNHYRPHNKSVKKGSYPLRPGVQGFFITCDGGRERQASQEAVQIIDSFLEELAEGKEPDVKHAVKPMNKKIKFSYSDSEDDAADDENGKKEQVAVVSDHDKSESQPKDKQEDAKSEDERQPEKKQKCVETNESNSEEVIKSKSVDQLIEAELDELKDKTKRRFNYLDSGCNGVVFVQMNKRGEKDPTPKEIAQHIITSAAATKRHMSRFILRVLPIELTCYASEEEISRAIKPLIAQYFPTDPQTPYKFAVLCEARANSGLDRMKIINVVAKSVPEPHKVDLTNPDRTIVVQIAKTVCCIGVVEKYKELAKYNLRQLTSSKQ
ncbi:putative THUMP domain-containing protein [Helianthus annuus]|uniref:THUMP domain-containing protein n=1 Tax=Helianthus annuus TaxID=4232 RepID=A0A251SFG5_HELAN|nr:THUMP domain-containing protein 1 [Helianthus annuus]KAF5767785.1 putative THUMP domain-containing protein [Helianthus annuus]KAJ0463249.1 putative THUMP domain-containing protein [Helianthus annuus]KAJ0467151.1 putative THUMP domain-containing protein [Helianthus annuus]KAJ0484626.1 putative THUMP domain-containing protein [Helianthus annuus]KAJ0655179.1 putative THUMP domain-containing protein [Helianthus annuus]